MERYCINPDCPYPLNSEGIDKCQACNTQLRINNRYWLVEQFGDKQIFKAVDCQCAPNTTEYWKVIKVVKATDSEEVERLKREANILRSLSLKPYGGIPHVKDECFFVETCDPRQQLYCLVMEFVDGQNLEQWLNSQGNLMYEERARSWLKEMAEILERVHEAEIVHGDINPFNIMLRNGHLVLIDFGIATVEGQGINGKGIGTPGYMAPEQEQEGGTICPQTDFYALGRTFVYLLTGKHPTEFEQYSLTRLLMWRKSTLPDISEPLKDLIDDLMEPSPQKRPKNAEDILQCLRSQAPPIEQDLSERTERERHRITQHLYKRSLLLLIAPILLWLGTSVQKLVFNSSSFVNSPSPIPCYGDSCLQRDPAVNKCRIKQEPENYQTITTTVGDLMTSKGRVENFNIDLKYSTRCNSTWVELTGEFVADIAGSLVYIEDNQGKKYGKYPVPRNHPYKEYYNDMGPGKKQTFFNLFPRQLRACVQTLQKELRCTNSVKL